MADEKRLPQVLLLRCALIYGAPIKAAYRTSDERVAKCVLDDGTYVLIDLYQRKVLQGPTPEPLPLGAESELLVDETEGPEDKKKIVGRTSVDRGELKTRTKKSPRKSSTK